MNFTKEDLQDIVDLAIFGSCVEATASWTREDNKRFLALAQKIKDEYPEIKADKVEVFKEGIPEDTELHEKALKLE